MSEIPFENTCDLGQVLLSDGASDPRSPNYQRELIRPKIHWKNILLFSAALFGGTYGMYFLLRQFFIPPTTALCLCVLVAGIVVLLYLKRILICLVRIYQRFAPAAVRNKCRFEPSCSQYMILSLQKYGLWKGLCKGIHRLWRCHNQDGGFDDP